MKVVTKVHFAGCPLEVTHCMHLSGIPSDIEAKAASEVHNYLKSGDALLERSPKCSVKLPEDRHYYIVVIPTREKALGEDCSEDTRECDVYFVEAVEEAIQLQELLQRLRAGFNLSEEAVNELIALTTSLNHDCEERTFDCTQDTRYPPGSIFLAINDSNRSGSYSSSRSTCISPQIYGHAFRQPLRESVVDTEAPGKEHSMVCMKPSLPLHQDTTLKPDLTRRDPITTQPPPTPDNLANAPIRPYHKLLGGTALHEPFGADTPTGKLPGILHQRNAYGLSTSTAPQGHTTVPDTPHTVTTTHFPLRFEADGGGRQVGEKVQEETSTTEAEEEDNPVNQENKGEENELNCKPVSECSQSDDGLSSSPPRTQFSPRDQLTHGQNVSLVGGMVPGIESRLPQESSPVKTRSDISSMVMGTEKSGAGLLPDHQSDTIQRVKSAPLIRTQPAIPTAAGPASLRTHPEHLETSKASHESDNHKSAEDANSSSHPQQFVRQESDQGVMFDAPPPNVDVVEAVEDGEGVGVGKEEVVMLGKPVFGADRLQVPSLQLGRHRTKKQKTTQSEAKSPAAPTVPQDVLDKGLKVLHALEHACNGQEGSCLLGKENAELCRRLYDAQLVKDMEEQIAAHRREEKVLSNHMKTLIRRHCEHCRDGECKVPHLAAGCLPAGQNHTPTPSPLPSTTSADTSSAAPTSTDPSVDPSADASSADPTADPSADPAAKSGPNIDEVPPVVNCKGIASPSFDLQPAHDSRIPDNTPMPYDRLNTPPSSPLPLSPLPPALHKPTDHPDSPGPHALLHPTHHHPSPEAALVAANVYFGGINPRPCNNVFEGKPYWPGYMNAPLIHATQRNREYRQAVQATDDQLATARLQYLQPNHPIEAHQNMRMQGEYRDQHFPDMSFKGFPTTPHFTPKTVIYSCQSMRSQLIPGSEANTPEVSKVSSANVLGKGGNGKTFKYPLLNQEFAVKFTHYRANELNLWHKFDHPNVVKLLVVMMGPDTRCFQFMPRMGDNLRMVICRGRPLRSLYDHNNPAEWTNVIMPNARHVVRSMVEGTRYLHSQHVQHCDLKASNILTQKQCNCRDIFHCKCPLDRKCLIRLADFDSAKPIKSPTIPQNGYLPVPFVPKSPEECGKVMGTPGYRAPEQFVKPAPVVPVTYTDYVLEGSMADIWSLGITFLCLFLGPNNAEDKHKAWILAGQPSHTEFSRTEIQSESCHAMLKLVDLCTSKPRSVFDSASQFAKSCLEIDFRQRPKAEDLLNHEFFRDC